MDFKELVKELGIDLTDAMEEKLATYYEYLIEWNEKINLTSIVDHDGVYLKHFYDSLSLNKVLIPDGSTICDIGAGAGFPSIPLLICRPSLHVTIVDSLQKRIHFLEGLVKKLELNNVTLIWGRAEEVKNKQFDFVTARAVARLNILDELCLPLVKKGGYFIAMKGSSILEEVKEATRGIQLLSGEIQEIISFNLPSLEGERNILVVKKIKETPSKYPRSFASIKKSPL